MEQQPGVYPKVPPMEPPPPYAPAGQQPPPPGFMPTVPPQANYVFISAPPGGGADGPTVTFGATPYIDAQGTAAVDGNARVPVTTTTTVILRQGFGPYPVQVTCPNCAANVLTETNASPGLLTFLLSGTLLLVGCWLGCCLIPCCIPECQDIEHRCPNCKSHVGSYRRL